MGAEPYWYIEKYDGDVNAALQALREREFRAALDALFRQGTRCAPRLSRCFVRERGVRRARRVVSSGNGPRAALMACFRQGRRHAPRLSRPCQVAAVVGRLESRHPLV